MHLNNELKHMPKGTLVISTNGPGRISYFNQIKTGNRYRYKGIGSNPWLIRQLARKNYLKEYRQRLNVMEQKIRTIQKEATALDLENILTALPKHFDRIPDDWLLAKTNREGLLHPVFDGSLEPEPISTVFMGTSPEKWMLSPYSANTSHTEDLIHRAGRGFYCRSKSEVGITGLYDDLSIPYHYDEKLSIRMETISPDIRGIRSDRAFICHEHWGLKTDGYIRKNMYKLNLYASEGFILGQNLLVTFDDEAGGLNLPLIREQIKDIYHLP
ncbi:MAG: hypothetical protein IKH87_01890 [Firmicutes bacterium]|nr:hypothetical protein [Bacillota bacterium]